MKRHYFFYFVVTFLLSWNINAQKPNAESDHNQDAAPIKSLLQKDPSTVEAFYQLRNQKKAEIRSNGLISIPLTNPVCELRDADYASKTHIPFKPNKKAHIRTNTDCSNVLVNYTFPASIDEATRQDFITAFEFAVEIWESTLSSPVQIKVDASLEPLGPGILGSAGPNFIHANGPNMQPNTWYVDALADQIEGMDIFPFSAEIGCRFSTTFGWYLGVDGQAPPGTYDFVTVVLHELGHGLDFIGSGFAISDFGLGTYGFGPPFYPIIYDNFVQNSMNTTLLDLGPPGTVSPGLEGYLTSNDLFINSPSVVSSLGIPGKIYAPFPFQGGSSFSHWDETTFPAGTPHSLMTPQLGFQEAIHDPGAITVGMFADHGWTLTQNCDTPVPFDLSENCNITGISLDPLFPDYLCDVNGNYGPPGTHVICLRVDGINPFNQPLDPAEYEVKVKGKTYPVIFGGYDYFEDELYFYLCVGGIPSDGKKNIQVKVKLAPGCTYTVPSLYNAPTCDEESFQQEGNLANIVQSSDEILAFPNPSDGIINIKTRLPVYEVVEIFDPLGNVVLSLNKTGQTYFNVDMNHLNPGFYFIKVKQDQNWITKRIVISK